MAQIPQINNPITSKNYNYSPRQQDANTEPFDIVKLTGVGGAGVNGDSAAKSRLEMGNRELIPLQVAIAKDPTLAVEMLKDLLNVEVLNQALITGHTELYGSLENLAKELYVTPEQLVQEIVNQEQQNTMFSGHEFYDVLREVAQTTTDPGTKELIGNLLKSINFAQNKNEILGALRANLKFLSEYYSPNEKLSEKLANLSAEWGADDAENYFGYLKDETLAILKDVSGSLLNDDKTQMLIPLITHNLSRYNNSPYMCKEYFNLLLTQISSGTLRESLKNSFNRLYSAIFDKKPMQNPQGNAHTMEHAETFREERTEGRQVPTDNYTTNSSQNQPLSANSEDKNLTFDAGKNEIQQNIKNLDGKFVENAEEVDIEMMGQQLNDDMSPLENRLIFDGDGNLVGFQPQEPVYDKQGNQVGFLPQQYIVDDEGGELELNLFDYELPRLYDEYGNEIDIPSSLFGETDGEIVPQPVVDESGKPIFYDQPLFDKDANPVEYRQSPSVTANEPEAEPQQPITGWHKALNEIMSQSGYTRELKASGYNIEHIIAAYNRGKISGTDAFRELIRGLFMEDPEMREQGAGRIPNQVNNQASNKTLNQMSNKNPDQASNRTYNQISDKFSDQVPDQAQNQTYSQMSDKFSDQVFNQAVNQSYQQTAEQIPGQISEQIDLMLADFAKINTMQELIDNLNSLLRDMPDIPLRERLYGVFVDIVDKMSVKNELPQHGVRPPVSSTLDNLTDFIQKNINNPALKSLDSFNASNLLQSLLNAPGVFTPLAHYILPLQVEDTRAFGELWVDNDENNPNNTPGTQRNYHLFLTFDVESIGRFEIDMYALGEEVNLSLLYPPRFEKEIEPMKDRVTKIIRGSGYQARTFETAPLKKPHNLVEVFPKITDKRTTLSKRV